MRAGAACVLAGKRRTRVQDVDATTNAILELGGAWWVRGLKVTLESTSDYWRLWFYLLEAAAWTCSW